VRGAISDGRPYRVHVDSFRFRYRLIVWRDDLLRTSTKYGFNLSPVIELELRFMDFDGVTDFWQRPVNLRSSAKVWS
jgi:hypothetical protein